MPHCYLLAVTAGSSLDQQSNNVSLFTLVEQVNLPPSPSAPPPAGLPLEIHAYFHLGPAEMGSELEVRFCLSSLATGLELFTDPMKYRVPTPRFRTRVVGVPLPATLGQYELRVEFRSLGAEAWLRDPLRYPIAFVSAQPAPRVTH